MISGILALKSHRLIEHSQLFSNEKQYLNEKFIEEKLEQVN
jgi:hypothetical protein